MQKVPVTSTHQVGDEVCVFLLLLLKKKGLRQLIKEFSVCPIQFETAEDTEQSGS